MPARDTNISKNAFVAKTLKQLHKAMGITQWISAAYRLQSQGELQRRSILRLMICYSTTSMRTKMIRTIHKINITLIQFRNTYLYRVFIFLSVSQIRTQPTGKLSIAPSHSWPWWVSALRTVHKVWHDLLRILATTQNANRRNTLRHKSIRNTPLANWYLSFC